MEKLMMNKEDGYKYIIYFGKAKKLYKNCVEKDLKKYNLAHNEIEIINYLSRNLEKNTAKDLVEYLGLSKGMISRTIDQLITKEILEFEKDEQDKRIFRLKISDNSRKLINDLKRSREKFLKELTKDIEKDKLEIFTEVLEEIVDNLKYLEQDI